MPHCISLSSHNAQNKKIDQSVHLILQLPACTLKLDIWAPLQNDVCVQFVFTLLLKGEKFFHFNTSMNQLEFCDTQTTPLVGNHDPIFKIWCGNLSACGLLSFYRTYCIQQSFEKKEKERRCFWKLEMTPLTKGPIFWSSDWIIHPVSVLLVHIPNEIFPNLLLVTRWN